MSSHQSLEKYINKDDIAKLALDMVKIPSATGKELAASRFYAEKLKEFGLQVELDYSVAQDRPNVIGRIPGSGRGRNVVLCGHLDTVPEGNCVSPKIAGDEVYGRGSADMKGILAAIMITARAIIQSGTKLDGDVVLVGYVDHEAEGAGVTAIARSIKQGKIKADGVVHCEGAGMREKIGIATSGVAIFKIKVRGPSKSVHTLTIPIRSNPISWTGEVIREIVRMDGELDHREWNRLIPERPCLQFGIISGGDFSNRLPVECQVVGTIRWDPGENVQEVAKRFQDRLKRLENIMWHRMDSSARLEVEVILEREPCEVPPDAEIVKSLQKITGILTGREYALGGTRFAGDPAILYNEGGVPTAFFGPDAPKLHSDDESIPIKDLLETSKMYAALCLDFCKAQSSTS